MISTGSELFASTFILFHYVAGNVLFGENIIRRPSSRSRISDQDLA